MNRQAVESDDEEKQITKSEIDKKRGCGPFRSQTREEVQCATGYLRPKYEFTDLHNGFERYRPKLQEKHLAQVRLSHPITIPRESKQDNPCERGIHKLASIALNVRLHNKTTDRKNSDRESNLQMVENEYFP